MAFNFGATTQPSLFGAPTSTASTGFGGFGTGTTGFGTGSSTGLGTFGSGTTPSSGVGTGGFGAATTSAPSLFGGFGAPTSSSSFSFSTPTTSTSTGFGGFGTGTGGFGLGSTGTTPGFGGFGNTGTSTFGGTGTSTFGTTGASSFGATPAFGSTGTSTFGSSAPSGFGTTGTSVFGGTGQSLFGTGQPSIGATGGSTFGSTGTSGFGGTGLFGAPSTGLFGASQPPNALQQEENNLANVAMAVSIPQIYGDERDAIIAKWNQLQAYWGTGKGFYSQNGVVEFKPDNPFCRFKALGYHLIPKGSNELGQVILVFGRREEDVTKAQQQIVDTLQRILGSKPTLSVCVEGIKPLPDDKTEVVIYVLERPPTGPAKRVTATDLFNFLNHPTQKAQICQQLNVESILPKVGWTDEQLKEYLDKPPAGVDPLLWQQAKLDNPDPEKYIPVPMIGFKELQRRLKHQAEQTKLYQQRLDVIASDLSDLQTQHSTMLSKLEDYKRKELELGHRLLKVIVKQEIYRKMGYAIQVEEETLKVQLEQLQVELNHPTQFKGRLNELMSQMRMQLQMASGRSDPAYQIDPDIQAEIKIILKQQQEGLQHLIDIIKDDSADLQLIEQGISKSPAR
ncbi:Nuclear pore complex protein Nup54 [Bulinus truncatus]|nr:Nuclear pore complex protein Nup54 [Bulinus truncatus]